MKIHPDLVFALVRRELKVRYRGSFLGIAWTMLQPLLTMLVLYTVFSSIFRFNVANYPVYALSGILFWGFFSQSIVTSMNSLKANASLLQKVAVDHAVFPLATVLSGLINLLLSLIPLVIILLVTGHPVGPSILFLPVSILIATMFTLGAGLALSPLAVFFSDVVEFVSVLLTLLMYLTPIFYPKDIVPEQFAWIVRFNPVRSILEVFRDPIYLGKVPPITHLSVAIGIALLSLVVGLYVYRRNAHRVAFFV